MVSTLKMIFATFCAFAELLQILAHIYRLRLWLKDREKRTVKSREICYENCWINVTNMMYEAVSHHVWID